LIVAACLLNSARRDGNRVRIGFGPDSGQAGKSQALHLVRALCGFTVSPAPESGDKPYAVRSTGPSDTSARHATANDPARIAFARSSLAAVFEMILVSPPWLWTSTEVVLRRTSSAAEAVSAVRAAPVEPRGPTSLASSAPTGASPILQIEG